MLEFTYMGSKKLSVAIAGIIGIIVLILGWVFVFGKGKDGIVSPMPDTASDQAASSQAGTEKLLKYEDEAGFSFEYPEGLEVKDVTPEDKITYSELEISSFQHPGIAKIRVADTQCLTIENWVRKCNSRKEFGDSRDVTLAEIEGKQVRLSDPKILQTVAIEDGVEYIIESPLAEPDGAFWNKVHNDIVFSFALNEVTPVANSFNEQAGAAGLQEEAIIEEEEVVE